MVQVIEQFNPSDESLHRFLECLEIGDGTAAARAVGAERLSIETLAEDLVDELIADGDIFESHKAERLAMATAAMRKVDGWWLNKPGKGVRPAPAGPRPISSNHATLCMASELVEA